METFSEEKRILLIDDAQNVHEDFVKVLQWTNETASLDELEDVLFSEDKKKEKREAPSFIIDHALQGEQGVWMVEKSLNDKKPYALAFVDMRMPPGIDGLETAEKIMKLDPDIQIVFCTAFSDYSLEEISSRLNQSDRFLFIRKPYDVVELRQLTISLVQKWVLLKIFRQRVEALESLYTNRISELAGMVESLQRERGNLIKDIEKLKKKSIQQI